VSGWLVGWVHRIYHAFVEETVKKYEESTGFTSEENTISDMHVYAEKLLMSRIHRLMWEASAPPNVLRDDEILEKKVRNHIYAHEVCTRLLDFFVVDYLLCKSLKFVLGYRFAV
jgi:hypothetical protein